MLMIGSGAEPQPRRSKTFCALGAREIQRKATKNLWAMLLQRSVRAAKMISVARGEMIGNYLKFSDGFHPKRWMVSRELEKLKELWRMKQLRVRKGSAEFRGVRYIHFLN